MPTCTTTGRQCWVCWHSRRKKLADVVVVGEDLGTVEPSARQYLAEKGVLGTSKPVVRDGRGQGARIPPSTPRLCMASVNTHDLPPTLIVGGRTAQAARTPVCTPGGGTQRSSAAARHLLHRRGEFSPGCSRTAPVARKPRSRRCTAAPGRAPSMFTVSGGCGGGTADPEPTRYE